MQIKWINLKNQEQENKKNLKKILLLLNPLDLKFLIILINYLNKQWNNLKNKLSIIFNMINFINLMIIILKKIWNL